MHFHRSGLTLLELSVVLGILAILASLLLVGVQKVRESSRRLQCQNNLHQIGVGLMNFVDTNSTFPTLVGNRGTEGDAAFEQPVFVAILPELEQSAPPSLAEPGTREPAKPPNVLQCRSSGNEWLAYRFSVGTKLETRGELDGILQITNAIRPAQVNDGLSNTVIVSERLSGKGSSENRGPSGAFRKRPAAIAILASYSSAPRFFEACIELKRPGNFVHSPGIDWRGYQPRDIVFNHYTQPNSKHWDCQGGVAHQLLPARSRHSGGVLSLRADGSVRWAGSAIDLGVWKALGTFAGNETFSE